jgi:uncharacterized membrane protein
MKNLDYYLATKVIFIGILVTIFGQSILEYLSLPKRDMSLISLVIIFGTIFWVGHNKKDLLVSILATCVVILVLLAGSILSCKEDYYQHVVMLAFEGSPSVTDNHHAGSYEETRKLIYRQAPCGDSIAANVVRLYRNW